MLDIIMLAVLGRLLRFDCAVGILVPKTSRIWRNRKEKLLCC